MSDQITYSVEGVDSEHGHVAADEFLDRINHLLAALNGVDRLVGNSGSTKLYYRIISATHSSPLSITLEPVVKRGIKGIPGNYVHTCHSKFFKELTSIRRMEQISPDVEPELLEHFRDIALGVGQDYKSAVISNGDSKIELDRVFETNITKLTAEENSSFGSLEGTLETVNIHGTTKRFWIYNQVGPQKVRCDFMPGTSDEVKEALGKRVRVTGVKMFGPASPFPFRIKVKELVVISHEGRVSLESLRGVAPQATARMSAVEFVRQLRDEWD